MILAVYLVRKYNLLGKDIKLNRQNWKMGRHVLENAQPKLLLDFKLNLWKTTTFAKPDFTLVVKKIIKS